MRNLMAPILAGGATCLETGFEAGAFWRVVQSKGITWYYAVRVSHDTVWFGYNTEGSMWELLGLKMLTSSFCAGPNNSLEHCPGKQAQQH